MNKDSSGNYFNEIEMEDAAIRLTFIERGWNDSPSIRIQIKEGSGHLRQGPEIPIKYLGDIFSKSFELIIYKKN